jgi:hypothetical protein
MDEAEAEFLSSKNVRVTFEDFDKNLNTLDPTQGELQVNRNEISRNFDQFNIAKRRRFTGSYSKLSANSWNSNGSREQSPVISNDSFN